MSGFDSGKLHVRFWGVLRGVFALPRCYTFTHSDKTGDLFLTVGSGFDFEQVSGWYTRLCVMRFWLSGSLKKTVYVCMFTVMFVAGLFLGMLLFVNGFFAVTNFRMCLTLGSLLGLDNHLAHLKFLRFLENRFFSLLSLHLCVNGSTLFRKRLRVLTGY